MNVKNAFAHLNPIAKLGIVAIVALVCLLLSIVLASLVSIPFYGLDQISDIINSSVNIDAGNVSFLKFLQLAQSIGLFIIPSIILAILFGGSVKKFLKLESLPYFFPILIAILIILVSNPLINFVGEINANMKLPAGLSSLDQWMRNSEDAADELTKIFLKTDSVWGLLFNIFMIAVIPAIGEEFLFRGVIQRIFIDLTKNKHLGIWISAILFSALHFQFFGFIPRALLGAMFGYLFIWSGNLWLPVLAHFANNALAVVAYYLFDRGVLLTDPEKIGIDSESKLAVYLSILFVIFLFRVFYSYEKKKRLEVNY